MEKRKQNDIVDEETTLRARKKTKPNSSDNTNGDSDGEQPAGSSSKPPGLEDLLDISSLNDEQTICNRFDEIARVLMHEYHFVVHRAGVETAFEIQEMEFYLRKPVCHEDPFTHGSEEQKVSGRWYFHRAPRPSTDASASLTSLTAYRGGTRKGLDLTFGSPVLYKVQSSSNQHAGSGPAEASDKVPEDGGLLRGGILLRSLRSTNIGSKSVSGPSLLVDRVLELSGASEIPQLVENLWGGDTTALNPPNKSSSSSRTSYLYLKRVTSKASAPPRIYKSPRIGIDLSHYGTAVPTSRTTPTELHSRIRFMPKMYRYFTRPRELTKGRPQTLYGLLRATLELDSRPDHRSLSGDKAFRNALSTTSGVKDALVAKYLTEFDAGRKSGLEHLKSCIGPKGKGAADSAGSYLKLMGSVEAVVAAAKQL